MYEIPRSVAIVAEDWDLTLHENYSGRYMYGRTCFGVSGGMGALIGFIADIAVRLDDMGLIDVVFEMSNDLRTDSMGFDTIFYFPGVVLVEDDDNSWNE